MKVALKSLKDGSFVSARFDEPGAPLRSNRPDAGPWEQFELVVLDGGGAPRELWRGFSDFRLAQRQMAGEDIKPIIAERVALGANRLRVFGMKANNTGWDLDPARRDDYWGDIRRFFETTAPVIAVEWTVFADTRLLPAMDYQDFWAQTCAVVRDYPHVCLELLNEDGHPTQRIHARDFSRPEGIVASHGSGLTDADPPSPRWDYASYHARRDGAKGFTNYDCYEFQSVYPQPCPLIPDEGAKPQNYGFDPHYAALMGGHAACGFGGTFHSDPGIDSRGLSEPEAACARAFFQELTR